MSDKTKKKARPALSPERIAEEALALVDAEGLDGFSYRALAKRLHCEAMSLYHYFPSKAHLFDAMAAICLDGWTFLPDDRPWRERLRHAAFTYRGMALRHPGFFRFMAIYRMNSRAGLSALNRVLEIFAATGLGVEAQARYFRVTGHFLSGAALDEALGYARGPSAAEPVPMDEAQRDFPAIMAVGPFFAKEHHETTFAFGLDTLLDAIAAEIARAGKG